MIPVIPNNTLRRQRASGIDGLEMHILGNAQDQLGQIMKAGKLVVYGDVGQTFRYRTTPGGTPAGRCFHKALASIQ